MQLRYCDNDYDNAHRCENCGVTGGGVESFNDTKVCEECASNNNYTVWVGAVEVVDYYVDRYTAATIAEQWIEQGYGDDVKIEWINQ
jgi:hypothetical protein